MRTAPLPATRTTPSLPRSQCGYVLDPDRFVTCGRPSLYRFRMADWPAWRYGCTCAEHAAVVRRWDGLLWMRSLTAADLGRAQ